MLKRLVAALLWLAMFGGLDSMASVFLHTPSGWGVVLGVVSAAALLVGQVPRLSATRRPAITTH